MTRITRRPGAEPPAAPERSQAAPAPAPTKPPEEKAGWKPPEKSLTATVSEASDALVSGGTLNSPPSVLNAPAPGSAAPALTPSAHGVTATAGRSSGGATEVFSADVSRATLTLGGTRTETGRDASISTSVAKNYVSVSAGGTAGRASGTGTLAFTSSSASAGFDLARGTNRGTVGLGLLGTVSADRTVTDLGPGEGGRRVELKTSRGEGVWGSLGLATPALAAGATFSVDRSREVTYRTTVPDGVARGELHGGGRLERFAEGKAKALGLAADALAPPALDQPEQLAVGDELTVSVRGSLSGGLALGAMGARAGAQATVQGDFELAVKKLSATQVELVVTPTRVRGLSLFVDTPSPLEVDVTRVRAKSLSQGFVFDLSQPGARAAYQAAVAGTLPQGLGALKSLSPADPAELAKLARTAPLPAGVQRTFLEGVETAATGAGGGLNFGLVERLSGIAGLSARVTRVSEDRVRTDGQTAVVLASRGVEKRREVLLSGTETLQLFGSVRTRVRFDDASKPHSQFDGLALSATFQDDKVRGDELDDEVVQKLNQTFGLKLEEMERPGRNLSRTVKVELTLSAEALEHLARSRPSDEKGAALARSLQGLGATERAEKVRDFVARGGLEALGEVHRWAGLTADALALSTEAGAYEKTSESARSLSLKYHQPMSVSDGAGTLTVRFEEVSRALEKAAEAKLDAVEDPFLDAEARKTVTATLAGDEATLTRLISVDHLPVADRARLKDELDRGWTTAAEHRLIRHLDQAVA